MDPYSTSDYPECLMRTSSVDLIILDVLNQEHTHLTSNDVYERLRERLPAVAPSTVYRALERLAKHGKVSVSDIGIGAAVYEAVGGKIHHHLVCQQCGRVFPLDAEDVAAFFDCVGRKNNFQITTNHLILFGVCTECRQHPEA